MPPCQVNLLRLLFFSLLLLGFSSSASSDHELLGVDHDWAPKSKAPARPPLRGGVPSK